MHRSAAEGYRVLIVAPYGRDAESVAALLQREGYQAQVHVDLRSVAAALGDDTGVVLATEEAFQVGLSELAEALKRQAAWSDIPFVLLAAPSKSRSQGTLEQRHGLPDGVTNVVVLERPLGSASLLTGIGSAMRARQRQFDMRDRLSELEESRRSLSASERELRLVADSLPVLVGFIDRDLRYRFANRAYQDWLYRTPEQIIGRTVSELLSADGLRAREDAMRRALAGEEVRLELPWPHRDGRRRVAEIRYLPRRARDGEVDGFYAFVLDVTQRKMAEEELSLLVGERTAALEAEMDARSRAEAALRQSQKMEAVGQLTGGIAHDFNNMLTGVIGAMDIMKRRLASGRTDDLERFMDAATTSAQRAAALTARLLAFSRRQSLDPRPTDVNALMLGLQDLLQRSVRENISLRVVTSDDIPFATADANQLENAILNLVINARDAMPDGGQLTVETTAVELDEAYAAAQPDVKPGRYVVVAVSDNGVGIAPDVLEKVFEPFFSTKPIGQGTGLGLSMIYGFARQSGGQVRVHSEVGVGTSVKLYLPVARGGSESNSDAVPRPTHEGRGETVLLVEDDPSVRILVREVLEELRYNTLEAADADAALPIIRSDERIDLLVSDVGLPGMNGRQLAEVAREHRPDLPILFVTGYAENAAIRAGFLGTRMDMITKPFAIDALSTKIAEMMAPLGSS